ncbi:MAG TPA: Clp protease N-terminal domain-containing protein [Pseudonocardiaceae bacterium]|nr:Clp protease N-terminal domain-containing protein [Pseudonocardiaceae bacterium]
MPKINVYLSDELAEAVKEAGLPVSPICQRALEVAVRKVAALKEAVDQMDFTKDLEVAGLERFTQRARDAIETAMRLADGTQVGSQHLLAGILSGGDNMAVQALRSLDVEPDDLREDLAALHGTPAAESDEHFAPDALAALKGALREAIGMAHNYIGCEHVLLGLVGDDDSEVGRLLRARGLESKQVKRAVQAALRGYGYARQRDQQAGADQLRQVLGQLTQRLDRIEAKIAHLPGPDA